MKKQPYLTSFSVSFVTVTVSSFSITPISVTITITLFTWRTIPVTISEKVQVVKWKACPVSARSRFTHRTIPLILVYTLAMKSHRTLFSSLNIDIILFLNLHHLSLCSRLLSLSLSRRLCESRSRFLSSSLLPNSLSSSPGLSLPCLPMAPGNPSRNPGGNPRPMPASHGMPGGCPIIGWNAWVGSAR